MRANICEKQTVGGQQRWKNKLEKKQEGRGKYICSSGQYNYMITPLLISSGMVLLTQY